MQTDELKSEVVYGGVEAGN